jgi:esterase
MAYNRLAPVGSRHGNSTTENRLTALAHRLVAAEGAGAASGTLYILHGFLGSGRNWSSFAGRLVERRPDWRVVLVDLRLHGESRLADPPHDIVACARDLAELHGAIGHGARTAVLGHSFGGKVALEASQMLIPSPVQTWVIDSTPAPTGGDGSSDRMLRMLEESPPAFGDREEAVAWIVSGGFDEPTARWAAMNLQRGEGDWRWGLDVAGLRDLLTSFARSDLWSIVEAAAADRRIRFLQASEGSILEEADAERIRSLSVSNDAVRLTRLSGGHWLHIDNPGGLLDLLEAELPNRDPA